MSDQTFLRQLAEKLREARAAASLSVTELAERSGLSRRYVTQLEAGRANPSVLKLARLANATGVRLSELCDLRLGDYRGERIALVGLRGAGKSTIGRLLARALEMPFVELDQRIERLAGLDLGEIFDLHGPAYFHQLEGEALEEVLAEGDRVVLATGGSIVDSRPNFTRLCSTCHTIWLEATPEDHFQRVIAQGDRRPMQDRPRAMEELRALLERRRGAYERCALEVRTSGAEVGESVERIREYLEKVT